MSTRTKLIASTAVIVLIVILFPRFVDMPAAARALQQADLRYGALASLAFIAGLAAYAQRWRVLLAGQPSLGAAFQAANVGHALNILLPLRAGEAARIALLGRTTGLPLAEITASVVVE
ncbi:MAG: lysylphosphatidylglycerol synthase domain-containing protein, partial [Anaerolineae bacterium]